MKALSYIKPGKIAWQNVPKPTIRKPTDVIGKVVATTICGSDLHILKGDVPETTSLAAQSESKGVILGHEAIIEVESVGDAIKNFKKGDVCIVSCITSCGSCYYCKKNLQSHCNGNEGTSGWILGHEIDGTQAQFMRVPFGDTSLYKAPENVSYDKLLMLCDAIPTSYEIGVINGNVKENDSIAIVGLGPVGLSALLSAKTLKPKQIIAIDVDDTRLELAKTLGATHIINSSKVKGDDLKNKVLEISTNLIPGREPGVDVAIECVGIPATFEMCQDLIGPGGSIANVGVHGKSVELKLQDLWIKDCKITTGLVSTHSLPSLLKKVVDGSLDPSPIITHHFKLDQIEEAYEVFKDAKNTKAMKIVLTP
jgi:alcohol dehydrogenase